MDVTKSCRVTKRPSSVLLDGTTRRNLLVAKSNCKCGAIGHARTLALGERPFKVPSFDVVSQVNNNEVRNAVNQAAREVDTRFDFKGTNARFECEDGQVTMHAPNEFQLDQMYDILVVRLTRRKVNVGCLERETPQQNVSNAWQVIRIRQGIDTELARRIVKMVKQTKRKVQVAIQGDQLRVSVKKRDELQEVITLLKEADISLPLQFINFRD